MSQKRNTKKTQKAYTIHDLFKGKDIEIVVATLLLMGKLKVDSVQLYRSSPIIEVTVLGKYHNVKDQQVKQLEQFLEDHEQLSLNDILAAAQKIQRGR